MCSSLFGGSQEKAKVVSCDGGWSHRLAKQHGWINKPKYQTFEVGPTQVVCQAVPIPDDAQFTIVMLTGIEGRGVDLGVSGGLQPHRVDPHKGIVRVDY